MATVMAPAYTPKRINYQTVLQSVENHTGGWLLLITIIGGLAWLMRSHWNSVQFQNINASNIVGYLTPLILTAGLIERAVEVVISPWRDAEADKKQNTVNVATTLASAAPGDPGSVATLKDATDEFAHYTGQTRRYAYALALAFSVMAVTAGVRALWPLLDPNAVSGKTIPVDQLNYFRWYDMVLSTLLLAGGAAGLHAPINAFTSFFQKNS